MRGMAAAAVRKGSRADRQGEGCKGKNFQIGVHGVLLDV
jgi:hypothetical protein